MTWGKVCDTLHSHPKVTDAGLEAMGLWVRALSHCAAYSTDGHVKRSVVINIAGTPERADRLAACLVRAGLWECHSSGDGWHLHDFLDYNFSKESLVREREAKRAAGRQTAAKRWGPTAPRVAPAIAAPIAPPVAPRVAGTLAGGLLADAPDPDPDPAFEISLPTEAHPELALGAPAGVPVHEAPKRAKKRKSTPAPTPEVQAVFDAWVEGRKGHHTTGAVLLSPERIAVIQKRLAEGYDVETLKRAAAGIWSSTWHRGQNDRGRQYCDIGLALRDANRIETFEDYQAAEQRATAMARRNGNGQSGGASKPKPEGPTEALVLPPEEFLAALGKLRRAQQ